MAATPILLTASYAQIGRALRLNGAGAPAIYAAASGFQLNGIDLTLPQMRGVIVANTENGINSYQIFPVTMQRPLGPMPINLKTAGNYAVLAATGVSSLVAKP